MTASCLSDWWTSPLRVYFFHPQLATGSSESGSVGSFVSRESVSRRRQQRNILFEESWKQWSTSQQSQYLGDANSSTEENAHQAALPAASSQQQLLQQRPILTKARSGNGKKRERQRPSNRDTMEPPLSKVAARNGKHKGSAVAPAYAVDALDSSDEERARNENNALDSSDEERARKLGAAAPASSKQAPILDSSDEERERNEKRARSVKGSVDSSDVDSSDEERERNEKRARNENNALDSSDEERARNEERARSVKGSVERKLGAAAPASSQQPPIDDESYVVSSSKESVLNKDPEHSVKPKVTPVAPASSQQPPSGVQSGDKGLLLEKAAAAAAPAECTALMLESRFTFNVPCPECNKFMEWAQWLPPDSGGEAVVRCNGAQCIVPATGRGRNLRSNEGRYSCTPCDKDFCESCGASDAVASRRPGVDAGPGAAAGTAASIGGATGQAVGAVATVGLHCGWAPLPSAGCVSDLTYADLGKLWGGQLHESRRDGECVPSAFLALLRHIAQHYDADSVVPSLLAKLEATLDPLQEARRWLDQISVGDSSPSVPGSAMRLGLLHGGLRKLEVSLLLLQTEYQDQRLASVRGFRLGSPSVPLVQHAILLYNSCDTHVVCLTLSKAQQGADSPTMLASCMQQFSTLPVVQPTDPLLNLHAAGDTADGAMPSTDLPVRLPSFCASISGSADHNGQAHGLCSADLAWHPITLTGQWTAGLPHGDITLCRATTNESDRCFTIELCTEEPYSPHYHSHPSRIAPGFLWPKESPLWCGRRVLTFVRFDADGGREIERTYAVAAEGESHFVNLAAVDSDGECVTGLPPRAAGGKLERGVYAGSQAKLCVHLESEANLCTIFEGSVRGVPNVPFARFGAGVLYAPVRGIFMRKPGMARDPSKLGVACLRGTWCRNIWVNTGTGRRAPAPLTDATNPQMVFLKDARECGTCHSVCVATAADCWRCLEQSRK